MKIIILGAGIIGVSTAWHLLEQLVAPGAWRNAEALSIL